MLGQFYTTLNDTRIQTYSIRIVSYVTQSRIQMYWILQSLRLDMEDGEVCAGKHFADSTLFIVAACVLHVFDIGPPLDDAGLPVKIEYQQTHGFLSYVEDSQCTIKPRNAEAEALIRGALGDSAAESPVA
ncbi:hypothetical protein ONZ51_g11353 [Trametes cubensis]|uniref:Uncharacterized protein n=1 Tax=Trametes cubensis TaxID=1111947 RepID=A0AAD7X7X9_9APHY|nr:hypothetical protein ONZ51_g11353 [Trametes cubensis]